MWYLGHDGSKTRIGYATSPDGISWTKYDNPGSAACGFSEALDDGCVFAASTNGNWDDYYVGYPKVTKLSPTSYTMYYAGYDQTNWRTGLATSTDGITWTRATVSYCDGTLGDGCIIDLGESGTNDYNGTLPSLVIEESGTYKMWYSGHDGYAWQIFYATSSDGIEFTKYSEDSVVATSTDNISPDQRSTYLPHVMKEGSTYKMWFGAQNANHVLGYATSTDCISWTKRMETYSNTYNKTIKGLQWNLSNELPGVWNDCDATDGTFNSTEEEFTCDLSGLEEGVNHVYLRYYDEDDLYIPPVSFSLDTFTVDTHKPSSPKISYKSSGTKFEPGSKDIVTGKGDFKLYFGIGDKTTSVDYIMVSQDKNFRNARWRPFDGDVRFNFKYDGKKNIYFKFKDTAGNVTDAYKQIVKVDKTPPPLSLTSIGPNSVDTSQYSSFYFIGTNPSLEGASEPNAYIRMYDNDVLVKERYLGSSTNTWDISDYYFGYGNHEVKLTSTDKVKNTAELKFTLDIRSQ